MSLPSLARLSRHATAPTGAPSPALSREVFGNDDYVQWILRNADEDAPLGEICQLVRRLCSSRKCSVQVYQDVMRNGMGIWVDKPDDIPWFRWISQWCRVLDRPEDYFQNGAVVPGKQPTSVDPAQSLAWARTYNLLPVTGRPDSVHAVGHYAQRRVRQLLKVVYSDGEIRHYEGEAGAEHYVRRVFQRGNVIYHYEGEAGAEHLVMIEHSSGQKEYYKGPKGFVRRWRIVFASGDVVDYDTPPDNERAR